MVPLTKPNQMRHGADVAIQRQVQRVRSEIDMEARQREQQYQMVGTVGFSCEMLCLIKASDHQNVVRLDCDLQPQHL